VTDEAMAAARKVLLAIDASDQAEQAFDCKYWPFCHNSARFVQHVYTLPVITGRKYMDVRK